MIEHFHGTNLIDFMKRFPNDEKCKDYLADIKWENGFWCSKCGHQHYWQKSGDMHARVCKSCRHVESATSNTLFHKVKFSLRKAFLILFELASTTKGCSSPVLARKYGINQKTAWLFMTKVRKAMASDKERLLEGNVEVDKIPFRQSFKSTSPTNKAAIAVELAPKGGMMRCYGIRLNTISSQEIVKLFQTHIDTEAIIRTAPKKYFRRLDQQWDIQTRKNKNGRNGGTAKRCATQLHNWIRGIFHQVSAAYLQGYLDEFCFRLNRHAYKGSIFTHLVERMMSHGPRPRGQLLVDQ